MKYIIQILALAGLFLYSYSSIAQTWQPTLYNFIEEINTTTRDGVVLKGLRYKNPGGKRALLIHGFSENTYMLKEHARELHAQGYDVYMFNFRGHGNGAQESLHPLIKPNKNSKGLYGFDNIITLDIPAMIDFVYAGTPIMMVGHSLGGVSSRLFLSGIRQHSDGKVYYTKNKDKLQQYLKKVNVLIANASPTTFNIDYLHYNAWTKLHEGLTNIGLSVMVQNRNPIAPPRGPIVNTLRRTNDRVNDLVHRFLLSGLYTGLINVSNLSFVESEAGKKFLRGFTTVQRDLIQDAIRWQKESISGKGFGSRNGVVYEGLPIPAGLNFFMVGGSLDRLAPVSAMLRELEKLGGKVKLIELKDFAHVDLAAGIKSAQILSEIYILLDTYTSGAELEKTYNNLRNIIVHRPKAQIMSCEKLFASRGNN